MTDNERYAAALHAMQTGVAMEMQQPATAGATEPKHLRVGVNSAMCDNAALVRLLIDRGVFTLAEYETAIADEMEREVMRYQERLREALGAPVTLH